MFQLTEVKEISMPQYLYILVKLLEKLKAKFNYETGDFLFELRDRSKTTYACAFFKTILKFISLFF